VGGDVTIECLKAGSQDAGVELGQEQGDALSMGPSLPSKKEGPHFWDFWQRVIRAVEDLPSLVVLLRVSGSPHSDCLALRYLFGAEAEDTPAGGSGSCL
jgi:hypothetical protein